MVRADERNALDQAMFEGLVATRPLALPQVVSRLFGYFRVAEFDVSAAHSHFRDGFDSRQLTEYQLFRAMKAAESASHVKIFALGDLLRNFWIAIPADVSSRQTARLAGTTTSSTR